MSITVTSIDAWTADLAACRAFYEALGLPVEAVDGVMDEDYLRIGLGVTTLRLRPKSAFFAPTAPLSLTIAVDDPLARLAHALQALGVRVSPGASVSLNVVLSDPDGREIRLAPSAAKTPA